MKVSSSFGRTTALPGTTQKYMALSTLSAMSISESFLIWNLFISDIKTAPDVPVLVDGALAELEVDLRDVQVGQQPFAGDAQRQVRLVVHLDDAGVLVVLVEALPVLVHRVVARDRQDLFCFKCGPVTFGSHWKVIGTCE